MLQEVKQVSHIQESASCLPLQKYLLQEFITAGQEGRQETSNGNYVQSLAYEVDAAAEIAFDFFLAGIGASYVEGAVSGIETAISTGSITAGCINAQIEINKNIESLKNMTYNAFNTAKTGFSNFFTSLKSVLMEVKESQLQQGYLLFVQEIIIESLLNR